MRLGTPLVVVDDQRRIRIALQEEGVDVLERASMRLLVKLVVHGLDTASSGRADSLASDPLPTTRWLTAPVDAAPTAARPLDARGSQPDATPTSSGCSAGKRPRLETDTLNGRLARCNSSAVV